MQTQPDQTSQSEPPQRLSTAATLGLLFLGANLLGCIGAGVLTAVGSSLGAAVLLLLPIEALLAAICGFIGLRATASPEVTGRGPAFVSLFAGAILFVLQTAMVGAVVVTYISAAKTLAPAVDTTLTAAGDGRYAAALQGVTTSGDDAIDRARLDRFVGAIEDAYGEIGSASFSIPIMLEGRETLRAMVGDPDQSGAGIDEPPKWVELRCARGNTLVFIALNAAALEDQRVVIDDMIALLPGGEAIQLVPGGRLTPIAEALDVELVPAPAELEAVRSGSP